MFLYNCDATEITSSKHTGILSNPTFLFFYMCVFLVRVHRLGTLDAEDRDAAATTPAAATAAATASSLGLGLLLAGAILALGGLSCRGVSSGLLLRPQTNHRSTAVHKASRSGASRCNPKGHDGAALQCWSRRAVPGCEALLFGAGVQHSSWNTADACCSSASGVFWSG